MDWPVAIRRHWFVAARSDRLRARPLAVTVLGVPLVVGRMPAGGVFAFEDRCPHRQVPLSCGRITAQGLQCPYHGWTFGGDGRCTAVPGLAPDTAAPAVSARTVACQEHDGLVWVRLAAPAGADPARPALADTPPASMIAGLAGGSSLQWQACWKAPVLDALENFLDPLHTHAVHPGLVRRDGRRRPVAAAVRTTDEGFRIDYRGQEEQSGWLYRLFESPRVSECAVFAGAASARLEYRYRNGSAVDITLHFTPAAPDETHVFANVAVAGRRAPRWALRLFVQPLLARVARQDQRIVELQAANRRRFGDSAAVSTRLDLARPYLAALWQPGTQFCRETFERDVVLYL
ncbi:Rieske 2Fe-2S domain-containing protein [Massilia dura]|uniref:Rieske 2Fe-2S domain-containing protein n=1 Tax=Pseudoduganella dura TaxID=321982 RepID=A0A6I3X859_9BURK|nr:aromatic ring-hydroxylating dioxygenase subunit alpha [Pseudoduganella dura]MUI13019.1 Rieske 2Fe-2S domain-containing protein [Pseudoduganella dura]GGX87850.1 (Fe-S)-binding protein [Pseudoduganella dura]